MSDDKLYERFGKQMPPGTLLFREGESGKEMYVVQSGKIRISKTVRDGEGLLNKIGRAHV